MPSKRHQTDDRWRFAMAAFVPKDEPSWVNLRSAAVSHPGGYRLQLSADAARRGCIDSCGCGSRRTCIGVLATWRPLKLRLLWNSRRVVQPPRLKLPQLEIAIRPYTEILMEYCPKKFVQKLLPLPRVPRLEGVRLHVAQISCVVVRQLSRSLSRI